MKNFKGRERFKVKSVNCKYVVISQLKAVVATAKFKFLGVTFETKGKAIAKNEEFNVEIGKRLARARAEKKAYIIARNEIKRQLKDTNKLLNILINTSVFLEECIDHQTDYIKSF